MYLRTVGEEVFEGSTGLIGSLLYLSVLARADIVVCSAIYGILISRLRQCYWIAALHKLDQGLMSMTGRSRLTATDRAFVRWRYFFGESS